MLAFLAFVRNVMYIESFYWAAIVMKSNNIVLSSDVTAFVFVFSCIFPCFCPVPVLYLYCIAAGNWELLLMVGARAVRR